MRKTFAPAIVLLLSLGCLATAADNVPPEGFTALWNGKDLTGWQGNARGGIRKKATREKTSPEKIAQIKKEAAEQAPEHWKVVDGALVCDGGGPDLGTVKSYGDFELYCDWNCEPGTDSGLYLRGLPQVQIWCNPNGSGGLYNNKQNPKQPLVVADNPPRQWNTFYIKMVGDKVTVKLNGKLVVDNVTMENFWDPGDPAPATGPIELQAHNGKISFRNIYVRELK